jgi:hypothetical protein
LSTNFFIFLAVRHTCTKHTQVHLGRRTGGLGRLQQSRRRAQSAEPGGGHSREDYERQSEEQQQQREEQQQQREEQQQQREGRQVEVAISEPDSASGSEIQNPNSVSGSEIQNPNSVSGSEIQNPMLNSGSELRVLKSIQHRMLNAGVYYFSLRSQLPFSDSGGATPA